MRLILPLLLLAACQTTQPKSTPSAVDRDAFNASAASHGIYWTADRDNDGTLDADELAVIWGLGAERSALFQDGAPTGELAAIIERARTQSADAGTPEEQARRAALKHELTQGYFTVLESDFRDAPAEDRAIVEHVLAAAAAVERIYQKQLGSFGMEAKLAPGDEQARLAYFINQGPWCSGPETESDPSCSAIWPRPEKLSGLYPAELQKEEGFCDALAKHPRAAELTNQFTAVVADDKGELRGMPYTEVFRADMQEVAKELRAAAAAITSPAETAFKAYLEAAAQAFSDNNWFAADEAWSKMSAANSKWYLRIGPDEVYFEPCSLKAGFHVSFARVNPASIEWQKKLEPVKADMERALAERAGKPYVARDVAFHLPDFIDIVVNAGDSRPARGITIGQSLPNWGPVANENRGRTVVMTNVYTDDESKKILRAQASSVFCADVMPLYSDAAEPQVMSTILHEAAHNLGPAHEYKVGGKTDDQIFGGPVASMLEEGKAQTSALFFTDFLAERGIIDQAMAERAHIRDLAWALGHISRGLYDAEGKPKPYSQLAAIQIASFLEAGALTWRAAEKAANGEDTGCLAVQPAKLPRAIFDLTAVFAGIKGRGDAKAAAALEAKLIKGPGPWQEVYEVAKTRYRRFPRASFLYAVKR